MAIIISSGVTHFTDAIAQNDIEYESLGEGLSGGQIIDSIALVSAENLAWRVWLFEGAGHNHAAADSTSFLGYVTFATADGVRIAGAGNYHYSLKNLGLFYRSTTRKLEIGIQNTSASGKTATSGETGILTIKVGLR